MHPSCNMHSSSTKMLQIRWKMRSSNSKVLQKLFQWQVSASKCCKGKRRNTDRTGDPKENPNLQQNPQTIPDPKRNGFHGIPNFQFRRKMGLQTWNPKSPERHIPIEPTQFLPPPPRILGVPGAIHLCAIFCDLAPDQSLTGLPRKTSGTCAGVPEQPVEHGM